MNRLAGKVAVITGVGRGIGHAIPIAFSREGARLVLVSRGGEWLERTADEIREAGGEAVTVIGSVAEEEAWTHVAEAGSALGGVDIVVNSAASYLPGNVLEITAEDFKRSLDVNILGAVLSFQTFIPSMIERGGGAFVNISSVNGMIANPGMTSYATGKAGLHGLSRNTALDFGLQGIRVNTIAPAAILTSAWEERMDDLEKETTRDNYPVGRYGRPEDVAHAAVYLASDEAEFVTGVVLPVDGGLTIITPEAAVRTSFRARWRDGVVRIDRDE
jgi:NAD(P)-dependent dehydrogenase (short-subunit alcohol dehydrogenase family)